MERDCINNFLDLISAFFHLRIISRIWNQYPNNPRKILIPKFSNNSKRTNKFPQPRFSFLPSPESFPMQMRILPNRPFLDSKRWRFRNLKLIREYIKKSEGGGKIDWKERSEKISSLDTAGYGNKRNRWTGVRLSAPIEYTTRLYRNRETNGADGTQKRIEARVDQTIRYRPLVVVVVVVSRSAGGLGEGGRGCHAEAEGSWNQVSRGNGLIGGVPRMIFDLRRRGGCLPLRYPRPIIFLKAAGGRARLAEIRTARQIET